MRIWRRMAPLIQIVGLTLIKEVVHLHPKNHHQFHQNQPSAILSLILNQESKGSKNIKHLLFWIVRLTLIKEVVNLYPKPKIIIHHSPSAKERKNIKHILLRTVRFLQGCCHPLSSNINIIWLFSCTLINMAKCGIQSIENGSQRR